MTNSDETDRLLLRILWNEADETEQKQFREWLTADPSHPAYYRQFQVLFLKMQWGIRAGAVSCTYNQFYHRKIRQIKIRRFYSVAASVLLCLAIGAGLLLSGLTDLREPDQDHIAAGIQPGKSKAVLFLASGQVIPVDTVTRTILEKGNTSLSVAKEGVITYAANANAEYSGDFYNQIITSRGGEYRIVLSDGSKIWMNAESRLRYPVCFGGDTREVYLSGEAYFEIAKDQDHPFIVRVGDIAVKVYGTQFNINTHRQGFVETVLVEGCVAVTSDREQCVLQPNQLAEYCKGNGMLNISQVDVSPYVAWKDGSFIFKNETLESIMQTLSLWYDLDVFYANPALRNIRLSGNLVKYKDVQELFMTFERISEARFQVNHKTVTVSER